MDAVAGMSGSDVAASLQQKQTPAAGRVRNETQIRGAAQQFESVFVTQMLAHMYQGIETDPMFGGGQGEEVFRSFLLDEYGKSIVARGGLGLTNSVQAEMIRMQEVKGSTIANG